MANSFLSNGLLGMGGIGGVGGAQPAYSSLLGDLYDPKEARKAQIKQMLLGMGMGLMSEKGFGRGAELALAMGSRAGDDYRQSALDAYRLKSAEEERQYGRSRDALADERWEKEYGLRQKDAAWQGAERARTAEGWQREDDMRAGQQSAVQGFANDFTAQGGDLFSPGMQSWLRGQGIAGVDPSDTQRYNKMQPYMAAQDYGGAFQQMTAEPAAPEAPEIQTIYGPDGQEMKVMWMNGQWVPIGGQKADTTKPTDDMREYQMAVEQGYTGSFQQYMMDMRKAGATTVNMGGGTDKQIFDETKARADSARTAYQGLQSLGQAEQALPGAITGAAAEQRLALQKVAELFGVGDTQAIVDTETFRSAIAPQVAAMLRATVGSTQISNADREFAEKAAAGSIQLNAQSIQRLINIMQAMNSETIRRFNADLNAVYPEGQGFDRERALFGVPNVPKAYASPIGPRQPGGQAQQPQASGTEQWTIDKNGNPVRVR